MSGSATLLARPLRSRWRLRVVARMAAVTMFASWFAVAGVLELSRPRIEDWRQTVARLNGNPVTTSDLPAGFTVDHSFADPSITPEVAEVLGQRSDFIYAGITDLNGHGYLHSRISFVVYPDPSDARAAIGEIARAGKEQENAVATYRIAALGRVNLPDQALCWYFLGGSVECYVPLGSVIVSAETMSAYGGKVSAPEPKWFSSPAARDARALLEAGLRHLFALKRL